MYVHITIYILHVTNSNFDVEQMLSNKRCRQISTFIALRIRTPAPIKTMPSSLVPPPSPTAHPPNVSRPRVRFQEGGPRPG